MYNIFVLFGTTNILNNAIYFDYKMTFLNRFFFYRYSYFCFVTNVKKTLFLKEICHKFSAVWDL